MDTTASSAMAPISRTGLQDLPIEVLDYILMKAVVKKVMDRKLAKSVWLNYASRVIQPMRTVCSRWNYSLATNWFRIVLSRILSNKDPAEISVTAITAKSVDLNFVAVAKLGSQLYFACMDLEDVGGYKVYYFCLRVFEVKNLFQCTKTIRLPVMEEPEGMAACKQSNSIYLWGYAPADVLHLVPDGNGDFEVLYWPPYSPPSDVLGSYPAGNYYRIDSFSVLDDGNVLVQRCVIPNVDSDHEYDVNDDENKILSVHQPDGFVVWNVKLPKFCQSSNIVMKSNGNFVYANLREAMVTEVDRDWKEVRNFHWKDDRVHRCKRLFLDSYDRVILLDDEMNVGKFNLIFLDAELNFLCKVPLEVELDYEFILVYACLYKETNELIIVSLNGRIMFVKLAL